MCTKCFSKMTAAQYASGQMNGYAPVQEFLLLARYAGWETLMAMLKGIRKISSKAMHIGTTIVVLATLILSVLWCIDTNPDAIYAADDSFDRIYRLLALLSALPVTVLYMFLLGTVEAATQKAIERLKRHFDDRRRFEYSPMWIGESHYRRALLRHLSRSPIFIGYIIGWHRMKLRGDFNLYTRS